LSDVQVNLKDLPRQLQAMGIIFLPILLIAPHDPGSALVFTILFLVLYREGLPSWYLWTGFLGIVIFVLSLLVKTYVIILAAALFITFIYIKSSIANRNIFFSAIIFVAISAFTVSTSYVFDNVFQQHHRDR